MKRQDKFYSPVLCNNPEDHLLNKAYRESLTYIASYTECWFLEVLLNS
jgi:hypothetical protein